MINGVGLNDNLFSATGNSRYITELMAAELKDEILDLDYSVPAVNRIAQAINICSQGAFLISVWIMHKGRNRQAVPAPTLGLYVFVKTDVFLRI